MVVDFDAENRKAAERKSKREEKRLTLPWGQESRALAKGGNHVEGPKIKHKRKPKRISARRQAFNRLESNCRQYILLRAQSRTLGFCEIGITCGGRGDIEVWYHIFPQASGNALKYDARNILGSCCSCNAGEYHSRKKDDYIRYESRHRYILGDLVFQELKATEGRRQIPTVEANQIADLYEKKIHQKDWETKRWI